MNCAAFPAGSKYRDLCGLVTDPKLADVWKAVYGPCRRPATELKAIKGLFDLKQNQRKKVL